MKNKSKRRQRIFALLACVCLVCSMFVVSSSAADRIRSEDDVTLENLSGTTWVFNDNITLLSFSASVSVSFSRIGSDMVYEAFLFMSNDVVGSGGGFGYRYGSTGRDTAYTVNGGWTYQQYKTITFSSNISSVTGSGVTAQSFLDWLKTYAELQVDPDPTEDLMSDVGDVLSEILIDVGDVANSIVSNPVLLVMCIGLPIISVVCGFLARLKDRT